MNQNSPDDEKPPLMAFMLSATVFTCLMVLILAVTWRAFNWILNF